MSVQRRSITTCPCCSSVTIRPTLTAASTAISKKEKSKKLELPEDKVEDFEVLLGYMLRGTITESLTVTEKGGLGIRRCMEYAAKYDMDKACTAVYEPLREILENKASPQQITLKDIEVVFRVAPKSSPIRSLIARGALAVMGSFRSAL
jgi:hypothetical protein